MATIVLDKGLWTCGTSLFVGDMKSRMLEIEANLHTWVFHLDEMVCNLE